MPCYDAPYRRLSSSPPCMMQGGEPPLAPFASQRRSCRPCPPTAPCLQAIVRPYLNSKYQLRGIAERPGGTLFRTGLSFRKWIFNWLAQLMQRHASGGACCLPAKWRCALCHRHHYANVAECAMPTHGTPLPASQHVRTHAAPDPRFWPRLYSVFPAGELVKVFRAVLPVLRFDLPTALFLLPYMVHNVLAAGPDAGRHAVRQEIEVGDMDVQFDCCRVQDAEAGALLLCMGCSAVKLPGLLSAGGQALTRAWAGFPTHCHSLTVPSRQPHHRRFWEARPAGRACCAARPFSLCSTRCTTGTLTPTRSGSASWRRRWRRPQVGAGVWESAQITDSTCLQACVWRFLVRLRPQRPWQTSPPTFDVAQTLFIFHSALPCRLPSPRSRRLGAAGGAGDRVGLHRAAAGGHAQAAAGTGCFTGRSSSQGALVAHRGGAARHSFARMQPDVRECWEGFAPAWLPPCPPAAPPSPRPVTRCSAEPTRAPCNTLRATCARCTRARSTRPPTAALPTAMQRCRICR